MKKILIAIMLPAMLSLDACQYNGETSPDERELVWSDEFDYTGVPDASKWGYDLGDGCPTLCGWGNNELQYYTDNTENARVENGKLIIEVHKNRNDSVKKYSSARLTSKRKGDWKYGYMEVRAKLAKGRGTWSAIWMLPTEWRYGDWPRSGEIDIMEHVGYDYGNVHGTLHTEAFNHRKGTQKGEIIEVENPSGEFHNYAVKWTPEKIDFLVDDQVFNSFKNNGEGIDHWPYDEDFHLLLNVAVGGDWGGKEGVDDSIWPQQMIVDYVRVYKLPSDNTLASEGE